MSTRRIAIALTWALLARSSEASDALALFDVLYERYYTSVLAFLRFLVGAPEDLTSLVFEKALLHLVDVRSMETAGPWLFRVARNCAVDYFRRCKPTVSLDNLLPEEQPRATSLEEMTLAREERQRLLAQLARLSEREREVIGLKYAANLQNREIAHVLSIPEGTVGSLLHRALRRLRAALDQEGGDDEA